MNAKVIVCVIDDDRDVLDSTRMLLSLEGFDVKTYDSAEGFLAEDHEEFEGCILTDVRMPGMSGIELLSKMQERQLPIPVVMITGHGDIPLAVQAMKMGAVDLLEKPFRAETLIAAIRQALARQRGRTADAAAAKESAKRFSTLSARENEVLEGLLEGRSNKVIARDLDISHRTVELHRASIMHKTGAKSLAELVQCAVTAGKR
jgi:two-component system response regulator FixJ